MTMNEIMMFRTWSRRWWSGLVGICLIVVGCSGEKKPPTGEDSGAEELGRQYLLAEEPAGAKGVLEVHKQAKDGDVVVIIGRIGGRKKPITDDRAFFTIVDPSLKACNEKGDQDTETPWDFC
jgi:hypothetical protein